jgi:hypothetical protein
MRVSLECPSYLLTGLSERGKNWVLSMTFHGLSNGISHIKIKNFSGASLVAGLMDPLLMSIYSDKRSKIPSLTIFFLGDI